MKNMTSGQKNARKRIGIVRLAVYGDLLVQREAKTLLEAGFDVDVVCLGSKPSEERDGIQVHYINLVLKKAGFGRYVFEYLAFFLLVALKLTRLHLQRPFACIQVNNMPDFLVFATLLPRLLGSKVTMVMYEPIPELWATKFSAPYLIKILEIIEQLSHAYAHAVFAVTEQMKQTFVARGTRVDKISVILNVSDERSFPQEAVGDARSRSEKFVLICHGAIEERYGHDTMLQAVDLVKAHIPNVQLRILGRGSYGDSFLAQIKDMGLQEYVRYLGWVSLKDMVRELLSADVGIVAQKSSPYSNLVHTGKMYDYVHFGLPVLASRLRAVEAYFDNNSLCFFEPGDAESMAQCILDLYRHPEKRRAMVENSRRLYDQYKWERQKEIYLSVYRRLVEG